MYTLTDKQKKIFNINADFIKRTFVRLGVLPVLLIIAVLIFSFISDNFLSGRNIMNVFRQSSYLILVSMGQMFALLTGGFDLSVGTIVAISSVITALVMSALISFYPEMIVFSIFIGVIAGILSGILFGAINGIGVSILHINPFIMTLGMSSVGFGIALYLTGGTPVYGMPIEFSNSLGFGQFLAIPLPIWISLFTLVALAILSSQTRLGRYFYAVGGNKKAADLSGINSRRVLFSAYVISGMTAAICGILLTARLDTGEANIGSSFPLESIAACVIAGVSLRGGVGRVENVVLGALFISIITNGMNLARIESYLQTVVIGLLLILAVIIDQYRLKVISNLKPST